MKKKVCIFLIYLFFLNQCGYTPLYNKIENLDFSLKIIEETGDREINKAIISNLKRLEKRDYKINYNVKLETKSTKKILSKNKTGAISKIKLISEIIFYVTKDDFSKTYFFTEEINIERNNDKIDEREYEINVKKNMGNSSSDKLVLELMRIR